LFGHPARRELSELRKNFAGEKLVREAPLGMFSGQVDVPVDDSRYCIRQVLGPACSSYAAFWAESKKSAAEEPAARDALPHRCGPEGPDGHVTSAY
jgi:hypothetical protein